jgi:predicted PurR-regulated permease PerM
LPKSEGATVSDERAGSEAVGVAAQAPTPARRRRAEPLLVRLAVPSLKGVVRFILIVVLRAVAVYLLWRIRGVVRLVAISLFLSLALLPVVDWVCGRVRVPRGAVILVVYVLLIGAVALIGYVVVPSLVKEVQGLSRNAPVYAADLRHNATFRHYDNRYHITAKLVRDAGRLPEILARLAGPLKQVTVQAFSAIAGLITVLALTFLLILHGREYAEGGCHSPETASLATGR